MNYLYGMRLRGCSIGCQPIGGFIERRDAEGTKFHDLLVYNRRLTQEELDKYELSFLKSLEEETAQAEPEKPKATVIPMIKQLEELFDKLNNKFFNGELEKPVITIAPDTCRALGWFTTWRAWKETENEEAQGYYEINVTCDYLNRTPVEIAGTLLHEMVHLYCTMNNISDTSRNGSYHNLKFKQAAEAHGLIANKTAKYGFTDTRPNEEAQEYLENLNLKFDLYRPTPEKNQVIKKSSSIKYVCPSCGAIIRSTKPVRVICAECGVEFEEA